MRRLFLTVVASAVISLAAVLSVAAREVAAEALTVRGKLARTVEAGGWLITTDKEKYLILNARRFQSEAWFREGAEVEADGETKPGTITIYQEGIPFEARSMRPQGGGANKSADGADTKGLTRISVTGEATVQAQPDTAIVTIAVVTQNTSASEAQAENASKTDAVVRAVKAAAGAGAEVKTSGYSLQPQYVYKENQSPTISGYIARNSVVVTMGELTKVGVVIDAGVRAGANNVDNLLFTLRRDRPARSQALTEATRDAVSKAQTLAQALGGRVVRVVEVQEGGAARPPIPLRQESFALGRASGAADVTTPIEVGALDIRSQVQLVAEIDIKP
ncbi:MAG: SIMPL domain-containing protein [Acidobacteriota bacterium]|nr:SIMPL domain-containing protein [Acidobacteriota bacterium]